MSGNGLGTAAFHCYPVLEHGLFPFFLMVGGKMVVESGTKKEVNPTNLPRKMDA